MACDGQPIDRSAFYLILSIQSGAELSNSTGWRVWWEWTGLEKEPSKGVDDLDSRRLFWLHLVQKSWVDI